jgi:cell division protein FtsI/penicillin-binding protein 2
MVRMRRSHVLLAGGALLGAAGLLLGGGGGGGTKAEIEGSAIDSAAPEVATPAPSPPPVKSPLPAPDLLDLDHAVRVGDRYEAPLKDGRTAILTLDPTLQQVAEKLLIESRAPKAAIVAMTPDGKILALAGRHADDPKGSLDGAFDSQLATGAWAPAASVFKLVTASALLSSGVGPDDEVCFHGGIRSVLESNLRDDKRDNQCKNLSFGVAHSNNAILGKLAYQHLEPATLDHWAKELGFGGTTIGSAAMGVALIPQTKDLTFAQAAAGFSGSQLSVIGGALLAATFADEGEQPAPYLIESISPPARSDARAPIDSVDAKSAPHRRRVVPADIARAVQNMMVATCDSGSASRSFRHHPIKVAGKTGTLTTTDPIYMEHSWFVGYAPVDAPELIVAVVLGNPENWHLRGQEAARRLIDKALAPRSTSAPPPAVLRGRRPPAFRSNPGDPATTRAKDRGGKRGHDPA